MAKLETKTKRSNSRNGTSETFDTRHDLPAAVRSRMIALLNQQLADTFDLMSQTKQAHWNVKGP